jgi:putative ABC transport system permease protein
VSRITDVIESLLESITDGLRSILAHKLRSFLTLSGIVLGVASVVSMFSIVAGIQELVMGDFELGGRQEVFAFNRDDRHRDLARDRVSKGLMFDDAAALGEADAVAISTAGIFDFKIAQGTEEPQRFPIIGMQPAYFEQQRMVLTGGRNIAALDVVERHRVAVVGPRSAELLFGKRNPIGREFRMAGERFTVVGTVRAVRFRLIPADDSYLERRIFVPVSTLMALNRPDKAITTVQVKAVSPDSVGPALRDAEAKLLQRHRQVKDYRIENEAAEIASILAKVKGMMAGWNAVLGAIAVIALLVGGIGLFSIMQIAVRERVREIGIRKAVGADDGDIRREFLAESLTLALTGGVAGILLGSGIVVIAEQVALRFGKQWSIAVSVPGAVIGLVFAAGVGLLFGLYPASKAARIDPIEAIRE